MKAIAENYKGIQFVRISALPENQKRLIGASGYLQKVIKIRRGTELLNDCLPYQNYAQWYLESEKQLFS